VAGEEQYEARQDDDGEDAFSLRMGFAAEVCPGCGLVSSAGPCPNCGVEVPAPEELNEATEVRRDALLPIREGAEELLAGFDALPRGTIPITATAMLSGFVEAALFTKALEVTGLGRELRGRSSRPAFRASDTARNRFRSGPDWDVVRTLRPRQLSTA
jgi:hypothetical protein